MGGVRYLGGKGVQKGGRYPGGRLSGGGFLGVGWRSLPRLVCILLECFLVLYLS